MKDIVLVNSYPCSTIIFVSGCQGEAGEWMEKKEELAAQISPMNFIISLLSLFHFVSPHFWVTSQMSPRINVVTPQL